jgi:hypothetical protein
MPYFAKEQATNVAIIPKPVKQTLVVPGGTDMVFVAFQFGAIGTETNDFTE